MTIKAIDPWVNIDMLGGQPPPKYLERVKEDCFKDDDSFFKKPSMEHLLEKYVYEDAHGLFFAGRHPRSAKAG